MNKQKKIGVDVFQYGGIPLNKVLTDIIERIVRLENKPMQKTESRKQPPITAESIKVMSPMFKNMTLKQALEDLHRFLYGQVNAKDIKFDKTRTVWDALSGLIGQAGYQFNEELLELAPELGIQQVSTVSEALDQITKALVRLSNEIKNVGNRISPSVAPGRVFPEAEVLEE